MPNSASKLRMLLATCLVLALLLFSVATAHFVRAASAQIIFITITPDGDINPPTAPIQRFGDSYILTGDVYGSIVVERSNITIDGNGHTIKGEPLSSGEPSNVGGVYLGNVQNVIVKDFLIKDCPTGIGLGNCSRITITGNNISGIWHPITRNAFSAGIYLWNAYANVINGNRLTSNEYGIFLEDNSEHNLIIENKISDSSRAGVILSESSGNTFYHNNFDNKQNVYDASLHPYSSLSLSTNNWDNGREGNFWSDYNGTDADGDGIGDTPHRLYNMNQDNYPLMKPWAPTEQSDTQPPTISILSPENKTYTQNSVPLIFSTNEIASWTGYSLDAQENTTVTGNTTINNLPNGCHTLTVYANDTQGNAGKSETVHFTIAAPEPFPTVPVIAAAGATTAVTGIGLLAYFKKIKTRRLIHSHRMIPARLVNGLRRAASV